MYIILFSLLIGLTACKKENHETVSSTNNVHVYTNGQIYTVNDSVPWAEAMIVQNGIIIAIGTYQEIEGQIPENAHFIDLEDKMVMPGIHDVHVHPLEAASNNFQFVLDETETNPENYAPTIQQALDQNTNTDWIWVGDLIFIQFWMPQENLSKF